MSKQVSRHLSVAGVELHRYVSSASAVITAQGARGGLQEWCVHLDRRGNPRCAVRITPSHAYCDPAAIPTELAEAATTAWAA
jgi:hypothetical protein